MAQQQQQKPAHWREVNKRMNAHLLFAEDIGPVGTKVDVDVVGTTVEKVKGEDGDKEMILLAFAGKKKKLGCNTGNCKAMETMNGSPDWQVWRGPITLVVVRTKYFDQKTRVMMETDAIRIHNERPRGKSSSSAKRGAPDVGGPEKSNDPMFDPTDVQPEDRQ
jgi:hypothetical protein